jgi:hypothetical protein
MSMMLTWPTLMCASRLAQPSPQAQLFASWYEVESDGDA